MAEQSLVAKFMEKLIGRNWITKLGAIVAGIGGVLRVLPESLHIDPQWSTFIVSVGAAITGFGAKDFNVHSTVSEIKTATQKDESEPSMTVSVK